MAEQLLTRKRIRRQAIGIALLVVLVLVSRMLTKSALAADLASLCLFFVAVFWLLDEGTRKARHIDKNWASSNSLLEACKSYRLIWYIPLFAPLVYRYLRPQIEDVIQTARGKRIYELLNEVEKACDTGNARAVTQCLVWARNLNGGEVISDTLFGERMTEICRLLRDKLDMEAAAALREWFRYATAYNAFLEVAKDATAIDVLPCVPRDFSREQLVFILGPHDMGDVTRTSAAAWFAQESVRILDAVVDSLPDVTTESLERLCSRFGAWPEGSGLFWNDVHA